MTNDLCYCDKGRMYPGGTSLGHVHAKRLTREEWAKGILAIADLAGDSRAPWLAGLPKAVRQAKAILRRK